MSEFMLEHVSECLSDCMPAYDTGYISEHLAEHARKNHNLFLNIIQLYSTEMPKCALPNCASSKSTSQGGDRSKQVIMRTL